MNTNKHESLKPCPFCGTEAVVERWRNTYYGSSYTVVCRDRDCPVSPCAKYAHREDAIAAWNTRAPATEPPSRQGMEGERPREPQSESDNDYDNDTDTEGESRVEG